jgi:transposase
MVSAKPATRGRERRRSSSPGCGLKHQPESTLSQWVRDRTGSLQGRIRKITIVAVARKLIVALWRYLETGVVPTGAVIKA